MINPNNYCVIMAGGVGSRFWPFSRNDKPKQFLDFFGTGRSLLQMTIDRFRPMVPIENILIVTNAIYREQVLQQIPDIQSHQVLCEPARRNTAPCIAYAMAKIKALTKKNATTANIVVAASDHLILQEEKFRTTIAKCFDYIETSVVTGDNVDCAFMMLLNKCRFVNNQVGLSNVVITHENNTNIKKCC